MASFQFRLFLPAYVVVSIISKTAYVNKALPIGCGSGIDWDELGCSAVSVWVANGMGFGVACAHLKSEVELGDFHGGSFLSGACRMRGPEEHGQGTGV